MRPYLYGAITTRGMGRKEKKSLDEDEVTTPTRSWVKEMRSNKNFWRKLESNGDSQHMRGKMDGFSARRDIEIIKRNTT